MSSPAEPQASDNNEDVLVIDIEGNGDNNVDTEIGKPSGAATLNIQIEEFTPDPVNIKNGNGTVLHSKSQPVNMAEVVQRARDAYNRGVTRPIEWRRRQLKNLLRMYEENTNTLCEALNKDLRRCKTEAIFLELDVLTNDLRNTLHHLDDWCKPEKPKKDIVNLLDTVLIYKEPYGVILIIGAWNYPLFLLLMPLAGAIAAGNAVIMKPSELAVACSDFLADNISKYLDPDAIVLIEGGAQETTELLKQKFDYIFFTGGTKIGKTIYEAATKNLTPVTLELGGKSPVYIDDTADIDITAKRILWGKFINAGQTCIAPDYVLCSKKTQDKLVESCRKTLREWYGENPQKSPDLCRIINNKHFSRLQALIDASKDKVVIGGRYDLTDKFIEPTFVANVTATDKIMQDEIFGPILPIVPIENAFEAIKFINDREKPLLLYLFTNRDEVKSNFVKQTSSGQICINDTVANIRVDSLPFGGIGSSGIGAYHDKYTFDTFTHKKGCLRKTFFIVGEKLASPRYPPYTEYKLIYLLFLLRKRYLPSLEFLPYLLAFALGVGLAYGILKTTHEDV